MRRPTKKDRQQTSPNSTIVARPQQAFLKVTRRQITEPHLKEAFLIAYAKVGVIRRAAEAAGINYKTAVNWVEKDPDFATMFKQARDQFAERLEEEAIRRAVNGHKQVVIHHGDVVMVWVDRKGNVVGPRSSQKVKQVPLYEAKKSDQLLMFLLRANRPDKYRDHSSLDLTASTQPVKTFIGLDTDKV